MECKWPMVRLGELLSEREEKPDLDSILSGEIPIIAKIGFNTGKIELRKEGSTKTNMILIKPGDLVISGINAAKGAIAIYGEENTKLAAATIHYSSYTINKERTNPIYLWYFMRSDLFRKILINNLPKGIKTEVKPKKLLPIEIYLPSFKAQNRIVAKIESLMVRINEIKRLKVEVVKDGQEIIEKTLNDIFLENATYDKIELGNEKYFIINPQKSELKNYKTDVEVSFVPMSYVDPIKGKVIRTDTRRLSEVKNGYTYFTDGDVLFAKITPCMENGNVAIAKDLRNGIGFGSTEFHIVRVINGAIPEWVYYLFRTAKFRKLAKEKMTGTAGHKRVPKQFLINFSIPLPPLSEQRRIVAYLDALQKKIDELTYLQTKTKKEIEELMPSILNKAFRGEL